MSSRGDAPTVYVLNISLAGLGATRSLGRAGIPVVGLDPDSSHAGFASRYCTARTCPHPVHEPGRLLEYLLDEGKQLSTPGILSPASDGFILFVSRFRDELAKYFRFTLPSPEVIEAIVDKRGLYELADQHRTPHATLHYPESMGDVHRIKDEIEYPVYLKPYRSHIWEITLPDLGKGLKIGTPDELVSAYERIFAVDVQAMVQSIIAGPAANVRTVYAYIGEDREPLAALTTRKIRQYPAEFGTGSMAESYVDSYLRDLGVRFLQDIGYRGFGTVEFKLDDRDGQFKLTDLNPRWVKPINLPIDSGVNFPLIHYHDLIGQSPPPQMEYQVGVRWLQAVNDLASAWSEILSGELSPLDLGRQWLSARSFSVFAKDDLGPFLKESEYGLRVLRAPRFLLRRLGTPSSSSGRPVGVRAEGGD